MKTTRRLLTLLLALTLMLSFALTVSAQENEDNAPYLSFRELRNDGEGWYEPMDEELRSDADGLGALDWSWRIYYLNTWDEDAGEYVSQPVIPSEDCENLTVTMVSDDPVEGQIRGGEANADHFVKVTSINSMDHQDTEVYCMYNGEKVALPYTVYAREAGFYTSDTPSIETAILTWEYLTNPLLEENSFYYIFHSAGYWQEVEDSFFCRLTIWDENQQMVSVDYENCDGLITVEPKGNGVFKIIVSQDFVIASTGNWANFEVICGVDAVGDEEHTTFERGIWVNPSGAHDNVAARLGIDGQEYLFYADSDVIGTWEAQFDENGDPLINDNGDHTHYWTKTELPEGVSYNLESNTLTLNNAHLQSLNANYHWANRDENGNIIHREDGTLDEGWNLPNANLKINLKGQNGIVCDYESPLNINGEVDLTINGTGSLQVVAVNRTENTRTEYYWNGENEVEMEVYNHFDAIAMHDGSSLTIAGNAKVTAEIQGAAYENIRDENGFPTDAYENAYLSAVRVNEGELTLKDNASLTTVLPEDARDNGPAIDGYYSGGYRGVENVRTLNIRDKATLTTSSLHVPNGWEWNEETQQDEVTWTGTYNQTGGTVTITALGQYGVNENDEGELIPHSHYNGMWTDYGEINISGGTLNVSAEPTDEEAAISAWAQAIGVGEGALNISGGTVNADVSYGRAINADSGDVTVSGGTVNLNPYLSEGIALGDWNAAPEYGYNPDGKLTVTGGAVNIVCTPEASGNGGMVIFPTSIGSAISGGSLNIKDGSFDILGSFAIDGGEVNIEATIDTPYYIAFGPCDTGAELTMTDGKLNVHTVNFLAAMMNSGTFRQTGGEVILNAETEEAWRNASEENGTMDVFGLLSSGNMELSGGTLVANGELIGFMQELSWYPQLNDDGVLEVVVREDQGLFVKNDARLNATGGMFGMFLKAPVEISGGQVHANATNEDDFAIGARISSSGYSGEYETEEGDLIPYEVGNYSSLSITGGSHSFTAPIDSAINAGLLIFDSPVNIENATVKVAGGRGLFEARLADDGSALTGSYYIISLKSGEEMEKFSHTSVDEAGVTDHLYIFTEDNKAPAEDAEEFNFATEILLLPDNKCGEKAYWEIEDGVLTISGEGAMFDYEPDFANERATTPWTPVKHAIKEVVVEEGITAVGAWSFAWLGNVTHISYPASLAEIRPASTTRTDKLTGYTVASGNKRYDSPDGVSIVDLQGSSLLTVAQAAPGKTYTVPEDVKVIGAGAMQLCGFEEVVIPEGVTELQDAVFEGCANLKTVTIPESVTKLGNAVFVGCDNVTVKAYCKTAGETYVEKNDINHEIIHEYAEDDPDTCIRCEVPEKPDVSSCAKDASCALSAYVDLNAGDWYHDGIHYCIEDGLMNGMSANTFEAAGFTTRAQLVTILYRAAGQPDIAGMSEPFSDVSETDWYYKSIVWAYNNQVVNGMTADTFVPNGNVTREQVATILYRYTGSPAVSGSLADFPDKASVSPYAETPMLWATGEGLINGVMQQDGTSLLDPTGNATRAQIATILMRYLTNG